MEIRLLGQTGLKVSHVCFGSLAISPLQSNLSPAEGAEVILAALEAGINFIDTAEYYRNYQPIGLALRQYAGQVHVASKSYAVTAEEMAHSVGRALEELGRAKLALFLLHEQESEATLRGHRGALEYLMHARERGLVQAIGISTHYIAGVRAAASHPEIDVIHPLVNKDGLGIADGGLPEMLEAIAFARQMGKGIYGMKALAGGHLHQEVMTALTWALQRPELDSVAVGMKTMAEVAANCTLAEAVDNPSTRDDQELALLFAKAGTAPRRLLVEEWCQGCGSCVQRCPNQALRLIQGRAVVDAQLCILCGYCGGACPEFALKII